MKAKPEGAHSAYLTFTSGTKIFLDSLRIAVDIVETHDYIALWMGSGSATGCDNINNLSNEEKAELCDFMSERWDKLKQFYSAGI